MGYAPSCLVQRDPAAARLDVAAHLRAATGDTVTVPVWLRGQQTSGPGWLHAVRLPPAAAAAARERCRKVAKRKGWTPSAAALFLTGWMMVFTTVPPAAVEGSAVLALYRCRRHVELMFKRLKSLLDLDHLRTQQNSALGTVWILGKLLYALVIERHIQHQSPADWDRLDQPRRVTPWRLVALGGARPPPGRCLDSRSPPLTPRALGTKSTADAQSAGQHASR